MLEDYNWSLAQRVNAVYRCRPCDAERASLNNPRLNAISAMAYRIAGSSKKFYLLDREERWHIRATAARMYALGADFSTAVSAELTTREGFVYAITNEAWPGVVKVGRAFDPESRLRGYQTSSPYRDYELHHGVYFEDCHSAETEMHARLDHLQVTGEWFRLSVGDAVAAINQLREAL